MKCQFDNGRLPDINANVEFRDDGRYELVCRQGHRTVTILQEEKYEVLFEIGVNAIIDGYYREAVSSFAACLERFYEFAMTVLLEEAHVSRQEVMNTWKLVSTSSERQVGAFTFLWLRHFSEVPRLLSTKTIEFRNGVVHKGAIPTREQAISFGEAVLQVIFPKLRRLTTELQDSVYKAIFYTLNERRTPQDAGVQAATMSIRTIFRLHQSEPEVQRSVEQYLAQVLEARRVIQADQPSATRSPQH